MPAHPRSIFYHEDALQLHELGCASRPDQLAPRDNAEHVAMAMWYARKELNEKQRWGRKVAQRKEAQPYSAPPTSPPLKPGRKLWLEATEKALSGGPVRFGDCTITLRCFPKSFYCKATVTPKDSPTGTAVVVARSSNEPPKAWTEDGERWEQGGTWVAFCVFREFADMYHFKGTAILFAAANMPTRYLGPLCESQFDLKETGARKKKQLAALDFTKEVHQALKGGVHPCSQIGSPRPTPFLVYLGGDAFICISRMIASFFNSAPPCVVVIREKKLQHDINPYFMRPNGRIYWGHYPSKGLVNHLKQGDESTDDTAANLIKYWAGFQNAKDAISGLNPGRNRYISVCS